ncbi:MAG TPA: diguanylate cyclase [Rhodopila sp.]
MTQDDETPRSRTDHADEYDSAEQAEMYRLMIEHSADLIIRYDARHDRTYVSPSCREMLGYEPGELLGWLSDMLVHPSDRAEIATRFRQIGPARPNQTLTFRAIRKDGGVIWVEARYRYLPEDGGALGIIRDITEFKLAETMLAEANETLGAANQVLQRLALQDGLTGLANRRRFDERLEEEFRRARRQELPLSVLLLDVDHFKAYNDRYGHLAGDECLRRISGAITSVMRRPGDQTARFGGEEFVVLLPGTEASGAFVVAEQIRQAVSALAIEHPDSDAGIVTVSAGTASFTPSASDDGPIKLIDAADHALYRAKAGGRNRIVSSAAEVLAAERPPA